MKIIGKTTKPDTSQWTVENLAYMAGLIDKGTVSLHKVNRKTPTKKLKLFNDYAAKISFTSKSLDLMYWVKDVFGGNAALDEKKGVFYVGNDYRNFVWSANGKLAIYILYNINPYLKAKKQVATLLSIYGKTLRKEYYRNVTQEDFDIRKKIYEEVIRFNAHDKYNEARNFIPEVKEMGLGLFDFSDGGIFGENIVLKEKGFFDSFIDHIKG